MLEIRGWYVKSTHGNMFQAGLPDLFATHKEYGQRWIEIKLPGFRGSKFTAAQMEVFPKLSANGSGIWVLTEPTTIEYDKLFREENWYQYLIK